MTVWIKAIGHWTYSNPGLHDIYVIDSYDVRDYNFPGSIECNVKSDTEKIK